MYDWGDLRFFLTTARTGSTLAAARELGVNQTTVARRIAALEEALGVRLFDRNQDGYRVSEAGNEILAQAERVRIEADTVANLVGQRKRSLSGVIRVTTPEALANFALTPWLAEFMELYPDIRVEVIAADQRLDLARGAADIALRAGRLPTEDGIVVRKLANAPWGLYCSKAYATKHGAPKTIEEVNGHMVVGADGWLASLDPYVYVAQHAPRAKVRSVCTTVVNVAYAIKSGHGVGALPCLLAFAESDNIECFRFEHLPYLYYLATPETLKDVPRIRAFSDFIVSRSAAIKHVLEGRHKR
jgi:DNA-binding transcriptional LysR family regulator